MTVLIAWLPVHGGTIGVPAAPAPLFAATTAALLTRTFVFTAVRDVSIATGGVVVVELGVAVELCGLTALGEVAEAEGVVVVIGALSVAGADVAEFPDADA